MSYLSIPARLNFSFAATLFLLGSGTVACSQKVKAVKPLSEQKQTEFKKDQALFKDAKPRPYRAREYALQGRYDWAKKILSVRQVISADVVEDVRSFIFDANGPIVSSASMIKDGVESAATFKPLDKEIEIVLPAKVFIGDKVQVVVNYTVDLNIDPEDETRMFYQGIFVYEPVGADPVKSRVLFTASEPDTAATWMLCDDHPQRRAIFKTDFTYEKDQRFIANGHQRLDEVVGEQRHTIFETEHTVPTYLMAFALGDFVCAEETLPSGLPTQYCMRRGLPGDAQANLKKTNSYIAAIESKLGAFPWEKYATVLIPEFPAGGLENAGMTFNHENLVDMNSNRGAGVAAHELGHQWFGDYVTVKTWDDLWIKEGMATFLTDEVLKPFGTEASEKNPNFYQQVWEFEPTDAVIDPSLEPGQKYTSGPYERASWIYSQLRAKVGADRFWAILRQVLAENRYSNISSEELIAYFLPDLTDLDKTQIFRALHAKELAKFNIAEVAERKFTVAFEDPSGSTLAVPRLKKVSLGAANDFFTLNEGVQEIDLAGSFLSADPDSVLGSLYYFVTDEQREVWAAATAVPDVRNFLLPQERSLLINSVQDLNPRERITLLKSSGNLNETWALDAFFERANTRYEKDALTEGLCYRSEISDTARARLNREAAEMLQDAEIFGYTLQGCYESLDPKLWTAFDEAPSLEEGQVNKHAALGMDLERLKSVWIPLLSSTGSLSMKAIVVRAINERLKMEFIRTLSAEQRAELTTLLSAQLEAYRYTRQERTLKKLIKNLNLGGGNESLRKRMRLRKTSIE